MNCAGSKSNWEDSAAGCIRGGDWQSISFGLLVICREYGESLNEEIRATPSENPHTRLRC